MRPLITFLAAAVFGAAGFAGLPAANAAQGAPDPVEKPVASHMSGEKLDATANAMVRVAKLKTDWREKITSAASDDNARLAHEAVAAIEKAVTDQGLSVDEYNSIIAQAQNNPDIRKDLIQRVEAVHE